MSNSQNKRNVKVSGATSKGSGRANATGPKVAKKPASREKALADARKAASGRNNQMTIWIVAAVLVAALVTAGIIAVNNANSDKDKAAAAVDLGVGRVSNGTITWGEETAKVTVDYYIDLLCPACRVYETGAAETVQEEVKAGTAKLVLHPVSILDDSSKPAGYSTRAASAVLCAGDKPKGYLYVKKLYEEQPAEGGPGLSDDQLKSFAGDVGLGEDWTTCFESNERKGAVADNTNEFADKGFPGTPTVLVNGKEQQGGPAELAAAIEAAAA